MQSRRMTCVSLTSSTVTSFMEIRAGPRFGSSAWKLRWSEPFILDLQQCCGHLLSGQNFTHKWRLMCSMTLTTDHHSLRYLHDESSIEKTEVKISDQEDGSCLLALVKLLRMSCLLSGKFSLDYYRLGQNPGGQKRWTFFLAQFPSYFLNELPIGSAGRPSSCSP